MGEVLPFVGRFFSVRDWTAAERAQIQSLAKTLGFKAAGIEVVYGASDAGDPWCVIKDAQENVLIHVARIGGGVVIHDLIADLVREGRDLWLALERRLADDALPAHEGAPEDFELGRREAQLLLALVTASAFGLDPIAVFGTASAQPGVDLALADVLASLEIGAPHGDDAVRPRASADADDLSPDPQRAGAVAGGVPVRSGEEGAARSAPEDHGRSGGEAPRFANPAEAAGSDGAPATALLTGGPGDDTLTGTPAAEVIRGGAGDDVISGGGAPKGEVDVLEGGAGDDRIAVQSDVVAAGGTGADLFVVHAPVQSGVASTNLGVIIDFDELAGDKVKFDTVHKVTITSITPVDNVLAEAAGASTLVRGATVPGERVGVDVDGDGVEDGYVLVAVQRGRIALGSSELGSDHTGGGADEASFGFAQLSVGGTIWISSDVI